MASETSSSVDELAVASVVTEAVAGGSDTRGKHRILAQLKRVEQDSRFLEVCFFFCFLSRIAIVVVEYGYHLLILLFLRFIILV